MRENLRTSSPSVGGNFTNLQTIPPYQHRMQSNYILREALYAMALCFCKSVAFFKRFSFYF
jgi:hypothetical protein